MVRVRFSDAAKADVREAIAYTRRGWGRAKAEQYRDLLREARARLAREPSCGTAQPEIHPDLRVYRIEQPGRSARHALLYRVPSSGDVHIARVLYDGMDYGKHLPKKFGEEK